jgi:hypothetical protein
MNSAPEMRLPDLVLHALLVFFHFLASAGALLIVYGLVSSATKQPWPPLEKIVEPLSASLTLIGAAMTAASIYLHGAPVPPPTPLSKVMISPFVVLFAIVALYYAWVGTVSPIIINGFSVLGLAGALLRVVPRPSFISPD